jgi:gliding motility-associated lipoprotein GldH
MNKYTLFSLSIVLLFITACSTHNFTFSKKFETDCWQLTDTLRFSSDFKDKATIQIEGSYTDIYDFQNIYLRLWMKSPSGKIKDTIILDTLSNNLGEWRNKGNTPHNIPFAKNLVFQSNEQGKHEFKCMQYMRKDTLCGIKEMGFNIQ